VSEKELEGVDSELIRGNIDTIILKALMSGDRYGYEIIKEIEQKSGGAYIIKQPTLYACLKRLEEQGFTKSYWGAKSLGGRKKYYTLTEMGIEVFNKSKFEWEHSKFVVDMLISDNQMAGFEVVKKQAVEEDNSPVVDKNSDTFFYTPRNTNAGYSEAAAIDTQEELTSGQEIYDNIEDKNSVFSQLVENNTPSSSQAGLNTLFENNNEENFGDNALDSHKYTDTQANTNEDLDQILDIYSKQKSYASDVENTDYSPASNNSSSFNPFVDTDYEDETPFKTNYNIDEQPEASQNPGQSVSIYYHNSSTNIYHNPSNNDSNIEKKSDTANNSTDGYSGAIELNERPYAYDEQPPPSAAPAYIQPALTQTQKQEDYFSYSTNTPNIVISDSEIIRRDYREILEKLVKHNIKTKTVSTTVVQSMQEQKLEKLKETQSLMGDGLVIRKHDESLKDYNAENYFYKNRLRLWHHGMMFIIMMAQIAVMLMVHRSLVPFGAEFRRLDVWLYVVSTIVSFAIFPLVAVVFASRDYSARKAVQFDYKGSLLFRLIVVGCLWGVILIINVLLGIFQYDFTQFLASLVLPAILVLNIFISLFLYKGFLNSGRFNVKN